MVKSDNKRIVLSANYSVIEPLFALHLLGTIRDHGHEGTFFPVKKYDYEPLIKRVKEFNATDVGFNVYSGNHNQVYSVADRLRRNGITVHIGGPHATYFAERSRQHADWVYKGQSYESFGAYLGGHASVHDFFKKTTFEVGANFKLSSKIKEFTAQHKMNPSQDQVDRWSKEINEELEEIVQKPEEKNKVETNIRQGIFFSRFLSPHIPKPDRATFYRDNEDMLLNPIKNSICGEGCPFACTYCYNVAWNSPEMYGKFKRRVIRDVGEQIEELSELKEYNTQLIYFQDDVFAFEMDWLRTFMPTYTEKVGIPFHAQLRLELAEGHAGKERLKLMKEAGCTGVTVAIENGDYDVRKDILDRAMKDRHIFGGLKNIKNSGLTCRSEQIIGVPGLDTVKGGSPLVYDLKTLRTNCLAGVDIAWTAILAPYGGTALGDKCVEKGLYPPQKLATNDDVKDSFFDECALDYSLLYKDQARVLQRFFSTFAHIDRGYEIAERFLKDELPRFDHRKIEDALVVSKELAKFSKLTLYDNVLYKTKDEKVHRIYSSLEGCRPGTEQEGISGTNTKNFDELLPKREGACLEDLLQLSWNPQQSEVLDNLKLLWHYVPRGEIIADKLLSALPSYSLDQQNAFIEITRSLNKVARKVLAQAPLDRNVEIKKLIDDEEKRFKKEKTQGECTTSEVITFPVVKL